ncbi:lipase family protein [Nitrospirillum sp. BR 11828]|uniref:lipase family protein n=1 Tax=Nitrospirillum sp. BR 11828 TaxID=3104325 RepID=UPI002ACB02D5|nr:hypothetical protein [Nitrospirillum sp. BR 11828]MDZ5650641.1 hypothetical protein [Nitrospirillum sp. BR 11828]
MAQTLDAWQTTFFLSVLSNAVSSTTITASSAAQAEQILSTNLSTAVNAAFADQAVQQLIGTDWSVVWGPSVYVAAPETGTTEQFTATNAMYVAYSPTATQTVGSTTFTGRYVVAIAGTNGTSLFDWLQEDFDPGNGVAWESFLAGSNEAGSSSVPVLTDGTFTGLNILLGMKAQVGSTSQGLVDFLSSLPTSVVANNATNKQSLTVTGHSLGGALAPTLALALVDSTNPLQTQWTASNTISYPTAGPTPGNQALANYYLSILVPNTPTSNAQPWQVWNAVVWNKYDVVPNAWTVQYVTAAPPNLSLFPVDFTLAGYSASDVLAVTTAVGAAATLGSNFVKANGPFGHLLAANGSGMLNNGVTAKNAFGWGNPGYAALIGRIPVLNGTQATELGFSLTSTAPNFAGFLNWEEQILYQHVSAYFGLIFNTLPVTTGVVSLG